jgi:hypothetical protein
MPSRLEALEMERAALHSNNAELEDKIGALHDKVDDQREKITNLEQEKRNALRVAHDATKTILTMERQLEALSNGHDTLREEMVLQESELLALRAALDDARTLREAEARRAFNESQRANAERQRADEAAALAASRLVEVNAHKLTIKELRKTLAAGKANALKRHDGTTHTNNMHLIQQLKAKVEPKVEATAAPSRVEAIAAAAAAAAIDEEKAINAAANAAASNLSPAARAAPAMAAVPTRAAATRNRRCIMVFSPSSAPAPRRAVTMFAPAVSWVTCRPHAAPHGNQDAAAQRRHAG